MNDEKEILIKKLTERLQYTLNSKNEVIIQAQSLSKEVQELRDQLKGVTLLVKKQHGKQISEASEASPIAVCRKDVGVEVSDFLGDFRGEHEFILSQTNSSLSKSQNHVTSTHDFGVQVSHEFLPESNSSHFEPSNFLSTSVQTDQCVGSFLGKNCNCHIEEEQLNLAKEFIQRETQTELALLAEVERIQDQMKLDRKTYIEENQKLDKEKLNLYELEKYKSLTPNECLDKIFYNSKQNKASILHVNSDLSFDSSVQDSLTEPSSVECSYSDAKKLDNQLDQLNKCIEKLTLHNSQLKNHLIVYRDEKEQLSLALHKATQEKNDAESKLMVYHDEKKQLSLALQKATQEKNDAESKLILYLDEKEQLSWAVQKATQEKNYAETKLIVYRDEKEQLSLALQKATQKKNDAETRMKEITRAKEIIQEELSAKHLQISSLKTRLESTVNMEANQLKATIEDYKQKIALEEDKRNMIHSSYCQSKQLADEREVKIGEMVEQIYNFKCDMRSLENGKVAILKEKHELLDQVNQLTKKLQDEQLKKSSEDNEKAVLPGLLKMVIKDKNEEIDCLKAEIDTIESKLRAFLSFNDIISVECLVDEVIHSCQQFMSKAKQTDNQKDAATSPLKLILFHKSTNTNQKNLLSDRSTNTSESKVLVDYASEIGKLTQELNFHKNERQEMEVRLSELFHTVVNFQEENSQLKDQIESLKQQDKAARSGASTPCDPEDPDDPELNDALRNLHNNSMEVLRLAEGHNICHNEQLRQLIEYLSSAISGILQGDETINDPCWQRKFLETFPGEESSSVLLEKLTQLNRRYQECKNNEFKLIRQEAKLYYEKLDAAKEELRRKDDQLKQCDTGINQLKNDLYFLSAQGRNESRIHSEYYAKWRRCLSQKKSLIYQKKYLLNVLGGFQLTERDTLVLLATMNITVDDSMPIAQNPRNRFRCAVLVVIAIERLKNLTSRYAKAADHKIILRSSKHISRATSSASGASAKIGSARGESSGAFDEIISRLRKVHGALGLNRSENF